MYKALPAPGVGKADGQSSANDGKIRVPRGYRGFGVLRGHRG